MGLVTLPHTLTPGTPENVNHVQANDVALRDVLNGNVDGANLKIVSGGTSSNTTVVRSTDVWADDLSQTKTFTGKPVVLMFTAKCETYGPPAPGEAQARINIDGVTVSQTFGVRESAGGGYFQQLTVIHYVAAITAGSRIITAQIRNGRTDSSNAAFHSRALAVFEL